MVGNNFIINNEKVGLIDFAASNYIDTRKHKYCRDIINDKFLPTQNYNVFNSEFRNAALNVITINKLPRNLFSLQDKNICDFELASLFTYFIVNNLDNNSKEVSEFFKKYLVIKAENYHTPMIKYLKSFKKQQFTADELKLYNMALAQEELIYRVLKKPNKVVQNMEFLKILLIGLYFMNSENIQNKLNEMLKYTQNFKDNNDKDTVCYMKNLHLYLSCLKKLDVVSNNAEKLNKDEIAKRLVIDRQDIINQINS